MFQLCVIVSIFWCLVLGSRYDWLNQADGEMLFLFFMLSTCNNEYDIFHVKAQTPEKSPI